MIKKDLTALQKLYLAYFGRPGDPSGLNYWLLQLNKFLTLKDISNQLSIQEEYKSYFPKEKTYEFKINKLYLNLFARKADFESLNFWLNMIQENNFSISDIIYHLLFYENKQDFSNADQLKKDHIVLENKLNAAQLFTNQISKSFDLVNLYQPKSIDPWITGEKLLKVASFFNTIQNENISIEEINEFIHSLSKQKINISSQPAIEIKNLSLLIPVSASENRSLAKRFTKKVINITGGKLSKSKRGTNIIALNNINLTIMNGERVALIGHNGSGKTSFLRLISGIYMSTSGEIRVSVNVYPMLQKTFLTSPELTGVDACKAHYLLRKHSLKGFDDFLNEIVDFSGLGSYISLPIKTYSEGMAARLIFSILTSSPHECLAIDEGFGTGDADFFERAEKRMKKFMDSAATLFLASHSEELLKQFCTRGLVFNHGSIVYDGPLNAALNYYHTHDYSEKNVIG